MGKYEDESCDIITIQVRAFVQPSRGMSTMNCMYMTFFYTSRPVCDIHVCRLQPRELWFMNIPLVVCGHVNSKRGCNYCAHTQAT